MANVKCETTRCGLCRFYSHEGRRGGTCSQLNVSVGSHWKACAFASSPFAKPSIKAEEVVGIADYVAANPTGKPAVETPVLPIVSTPVAAPLSKASLSPATAR